MGDILVIRASANSRPLCVDNPIWLVYTKFRGESDFTALVNQH